MNRRTKIIFLSLVMAVISSITRFFVPDCEPFFITRAYAQVTSNDNGKGTGAADTVKTKKPRYSVRRTSTETEDDVRYRSTDLRNPDNLKTEVSYDEASNTYNVGTTLTKPDKKGAASDKKSTASGSASSTARKDGDKHATNVKLGSFLPGNPFGWNLTTATSYLTPPMTMTADEYMNWSLRQSMAQYYRHRNPELFQTQGNDKFNFTDMRFSLGQAEKIFGLGGVHIRTQGSSELKIGGNMKSTDNPTLAASRRKSFGLDFDMKINLSVTAKVGLSVDFILPPIFSSDDPCVRMCTPPGPKIFSA
ncbi:MAG: hypothetical protein J6P96_05795 [Bacteroidaceae bacterium]|nr:hypothetical protein [Bacteroidaceae bacterium]